MAGLGGVMPHPLPTDDCGRMAIDAVEGAVRWDDPHLPRTRLILVENSFGGRSGAALPPEYFTRIREVADRHELKVHLDGARLFNAAVALGVEAPTLTRDVESVTFCLSKGLCAPVGSVLCGSREFIDGARRARKSVGGGMRQVGVLAAAGIVALKEMTDRLVEDHVNARALAGALAEIPGVEIDLGQVQTNIVHFELDPALRVSGEDLVRRLQEEHGIGLLSYPPNHLRAVTHYWVGSSEIEQLVRAVRDLL
jgi:threonine aldolase